MVPMLTPPPFPRPTRTGKIAILHSFPGRAEQESAVRVAIAARRLGLTALVATSAEDLTAFQPDLVLSLTQHETRPAEFPSYVLMMAPLSWFNRDAATIARVLAYDGFLTISDSVAAWIRQAAAACGQAEPLIASFCATVPTPSPPAAGRSFHHLAYVGTNWDGWRNLPLFQSLSERNDVRFHGPADSWRHLPARCHGGALPFDGESVIRAYAEAGIGLGLERPDFLPDDLPTNRVFEISAAGAVALMADTPFIRRAFGETVLALDHLAPPPALAWQIGRHLDHIARHPEQASAMADAAHAIFRRDWTQERLLENLLRLHTRAQGRPPPPPVTEAALAAFIATEAPVETTLALEQNCADERVIAWNWPADASARVDVYAEAARSGPGVTARLTDQNGRILWTQSLESGPAIGGLVRFGTALPDRGTGSAMTLTLDGAPVLATRIAQVLPSAAIALSELAAAGRIWIYGSGEGGIRMASHLRDSAGAVPTGFIDDFRTGAIAGVPVAPLESWREQLRPDDAVILANQHWPALWHRLRAISRAKVFVAHPGYGPTVHALPPEPQP